MFDAAQYAGYHWPLVSIFALPVLLWFIVLGCATFALTTKRYDVHPDDPEDAKRIVLGIADTKQRWLNRGLYVLMGSFVVLFVYIFPIYLSDTFISK